MKKQTFTEPDSKDEQIFPAAAAEPVVEAPIVAKPAPSPEILTRIKYHRDQAEAAQKSRDKIAAQLEQVNPNDALVTLTREDERLQGIIAANLNFVAMIEASLKE